MKSPEWTSRGKGKSASGTAVASGNQFLAFVAMEKAVAIDVNALVADITRLSGPLAVAAQALGAAPLGRPIMIAINGSPYTIMKVERSLPPDILEAALQKTRDWPSARDVMGKCGAHLIAAPIQPAASHAEALDHAANLTLLCAALATVEGVRAVLWSSTDVLNEPARIVQASDEVAHKRVPLLAWVDITLFAGPKADNGKQLFGAVTTGLSAFIGRELQFEPADMAPDEIAKRVLGLAGELVRRGQFVRHGDTVGVSAIESIFVKEMPTGLRPDIPVLSLALSRRPA